MVKKINLNDALKEAELFTDGDWIESKDQDQNGDVRLIQLADVGNGKYINKSSRFMTLKNAEKLKCTFLKKGDILIARMPEPLGRSCLFIGDEKPCVTVVDICIIRPSAMINNSYLSYQINSPYVRNQINNYITGTTRKRISRSNLGKVEIFLPSLEKQKQITETLDKAIELINLRKESITKLEELSKSIFIDMFGDPLSNPKKWEIKKLKELSTHILSGNTPKGGSQVYVNEGIQFFRSQNVWKNKIILDDIAFIDKETHLKMKKSSLKYKDILMTKTGRINTENSSLGRASLFLGEDDSGNINGHVYLIRLNKSMIHEFVLYILTTEEYRDYIRSVCVGAIDKRQINKTHIEDFPIIFPSIELQNKFASIFRKIEEQKTLYTQELEKLQENFDALLQKSFQE